MTSENDSVAAAHRVHRAFGHGDSKRVALDNVSLQIAKGEFLAITGPSGSGKSTLLGIIGTLDRGFSGDLRLFGHDVRRLSDRELSRLRGERIGFVFQAFHLLDHLSVIENVLVPFLFSSRSSSTAAGIQALERVGLADRAKDKAGALSGGQRQRVAVARALVHTPELLLCDEPTGNLDNTTAAQVIDVFTSLHREGGVTVVCATHDERISDIATRTVTIAQDAHPGSTTVAAPLVGAVRCECRPNRCPKGSAPCRVAEGDMNRTEMAKQP